MSNRDRIDRMAQEAEATRKETDAEKTAKESVKTGAKKSAKKKAPAARSSTSSGAAKRAAGRTKIVWAVCDQTGSTVATYPYAQEQEARAEVERLTAANGKTHFVTRSEVPFK